MYTKANVKGLNLADKKKYYSSAKATYYNSTDGKVIMDDATFDYLESLIQKEDPKWVGLKKTGIKVGKKVEVALDCHCPSLEKLLHDDTNKVTRWLKKMQQISDKLNASAKYDGSSIQATWVKGTLTRLRTRGDGIKGKDISYFIPYVNLPKQLPVPVDDLVVIRFEAVMNRKVYEKKWAKKFDSSRAAASAVFNRQDVHPAMKDITFIALKTQSHSYHGPHYSFPVMKNRYGLTIPKHTTLSITKILEDLSILERLTIRLKSDSEYDLDGIVLQSGTDSDCCDFFADTEDKPEFAKAFKVNTELEDAVEATITEVVIKASSYGVLVPKAVITPTKIGDVTVRQAAMHNFKRAVDWGLDVGAKVKIIRGGDIIPKIIGVTKPVKFKSFPDKKVVGNYTWDDTETHLVLTDSSTNKDVTVQKFIRYFTSLELEGLKEAFARKLVDAGYTDTWELVDITEKQIQHLPGIKASAKKLYNELARVRQGEFTMVQLMVASGVFDKGVGETRLQTLYDSSEKHSMLLTIKESKRSHIEKAIADVKGCGPAFAKLYMDGYPNYCEWYKLAGQPPYTEPIKKSVAVKTGRLAYQRIAFTGYRDKAEEAAVIKSGAEVVEFTKKPTILLYRPDGKQSTKIDKAKEKGILVMQFKELVL